MACTMPGFPDKYMPFMDAGIGARVREDRRFAHGPFVKYLRQQRIKRSLDVEPEWRKRGAALTTGYGR